MVPESAAGGEEDAGEDGCADNGEGEKAAEVTKVGEAGKLGRTRAKKKSGDGGLEDVQRAQGEVLDLEVQPVDDERSGKLPGHAHGQIRRPAPARRQQQVREKNAIGDPDEVAPHIQPDEHRRRDAGQRAAGQAQRKPGVRTFQPEPAPGYGRRRQEHLSMRLIGLARRLSRAER